MSQKNVAYDYLKNAILSNELLCGSPIREMDIAKKLKMSRTPIREALRELESEGLIETYPSRGTIVSKITPYDVEEIYSLRVLLETWGLEQSLSKITVAELDEIENIFNKSYNARNWEDHHNADRMLHQLIVEKSGSKRLIMFINTLNTQIERVRRFDEYDPTRRDNSYTEHLQIIAMIRKRDLEGSKIALKNHLRAVANSAVEVTRIINAATSRR